MLGFDGAAEAGEVGVAHVIDENDDDVGLGGGVCLAQRRGDAEEEKEDGGESGIDHDY